MLAFFVGLPIVVMLLLWAKPIAGLAVALDSITFLGAMLGAQAAIAALTLAVMLFVMQGVNARRDVDDRIYAEYIRRSQVWPVFVGSMSAVAVTGAVLATERLIGDAGTIAQGVPGIPNLAILAVVALFVSLAAPVLLFARAIILSEPEHWQSLRLDVNKREVSQAVGVYLNRIRRRDLGILIPGPGERTANQAIQALLDDARRAMDERRHGELVRSLDSIKTLVSYAMEEIESAGVEWRPPGSDADWPPLEELGRMLYSFREEVIRAGNRDYLHELLSLDHWFVYTGLNRPCGELFTFGLNGYRWNYQISTRVGSQDFHGMLRDRFFSNLEILTFGYEPEALLPFMLEVIRHQGNVLGDALHSNRVDDFRWLHSEFGSILSNILEQWNMEAGFSGDQIEEYSRLARENRLALMGLAGHAAVLDISGDLSDAAPYLAVAREVYGNPAVLAEDISVALLFEPFERSVSYRQWDQWEVPEHIGGWAGVVAPERHPLTCFAILLMGMTDDATLDLNLGGNAKRILDWFSANSERLERFVPYSSSVSAQQRRQFATEVLQKAVQRDEVAADLETIRRQISADRVDAYESGVTSALLKAASVERSFDQAGTLLVLDAIAKDAPDERGFQRLLPKMCFVDAQAGDLTYTAPFGGSDLGRGLARDAIQLLCEAMGGAAQIEAALGTGDEILRAIDAALVDLAYPGNVVVVLAGHLRGHLLSLHMMEVEEYEPYWGLPGVDALVDIGRYRRHPILQGPMSGESRVYVVDISTWGRFVRAPIGDERDIRVDVELISPERAEEFLQENPDRFPDQPDHESKKRKLQAHVEVAVGIRHSFRVDDATRARRIVPTERSAEDDLDESESVPEHGGLGYLGADMAEPDVPAE